MIMKNKIFQIFALIIIGLLSAVDLVTSELNEVSEKTVDKEKTEKFEFLVRRGDSYFEWHLPYSLEAIVSYKKALEIDSLNQEVLFRIAYFYDMLDSVHIAKQYYQKLFTEYLKIYDRSREITYPEINVKNVVNNFNNENSFVETFRKYSKRSSITLDYYYSNNHQWIRHRDWFDYYIRKIFHKKIYFTIYGNGEFDARTYDFKSDSKKYMSGTFPDSILIKILKTIENGRLLSLKKLFVEEESEINRFYGIDDNIPPNDFNLYPRFFERISIKTPEFNHCIKATNLVDRKEDKIFSPRSDSTINLNYNNTLEDKQEAKLQLLSELWKYIFWMDLSKYETD